MEGPVNHAESPRQGERFVRITVAVAFDFVHGIEIGVFDRERVLLPDRLDDREPACLVS